MFYVLLRRGSDRLQFMKKIRQIKLNNDVDKTVEVRRVVILDSDIYSQALI